MLLSVYRILTPIPPQFKGFESRYVKLGLGDPTPEHVDAAKMTSPLGPS
jgi:hypothetical protein